MNYEIKHQDKFKFIEIGAGEPLVLLHGLFGALSNFKDLIDYFSTNYKVVVPMLPLFNSVRVRPGPRRLFSRPWQPFRRISRAGKRP